MHPIYNRGERVQARSVGPNPTGPAYMIAWEDMKVEKEKLDAVLAQLLKMKPIPMKGLKTRGRKGSKAPLIPPKQ